MLFNKMFFSILEYTCLLLFISRERNSVAVLTAAYLTCRVSLTNPTDESSETILTFNKILCVDDIDYICSISYDTNGIIHMKNTSSTSITVTTLGISTNASDITEIASRSATECASVCTRNNLCHRASYDRMTKRCRIFNDQTNRNRDVGLDVVHTSVFLKKVDDVCSSDWLLFEGNCYFFGVSKLSWADAQNDCNQRRSCLVTIQNEREHNWLVYAIENSDNNGDNFWIGANDIVIENDWVWESDNSKLLFKHWHDGQPNNYHNQDCGQLWYDNSLYKWDDEKCQNMYLYICEK